MAALDDNFYDAVGIETGAEDLVGSLSAIFWTLTVLMVSHRRGLDEESSELKTFSELQRATCILMTSVERDAKALFDLARKHRLSLPRDAVVHE